MTDLWNPAIGYLRDHDPSPELLYDSLDEVVEALRQWGKQHGVAYARWKRVYNKQRQLKCQLMVCNPYGAPSNKHKLEDEDRVRQGASSYKTGCKMALYVHATLTDSQWRIVHQESRKSIIHNHPPVEDVYALACYRTEQMSPEVIEKVVSYMPILRSATKTILMLKKDFPTLRI